MDWHRMNRWQQAEARRMAYGLLADVPAASVSQVAKHFDACQDYRDRDITLQQLLAVTGWAPPKPKTVTITARELAARLGMSITTAYRRCRAGTVAAAKDTAGRWVITVPAA